MARSSDYIPLYQGDKEMLLASLAHVQRVAAQIIDELAAVNDAKPEADERQVAARAS